MTYNKGAMFGLDARIALAIFGALSVISGAALYSAIKSAQTEQWRQHFEELIKASEAYFLDTGQHIPRYTGHSYDSYYTGDLIVNRESLKNWNGPYIQATSPSTTSIQNNMSAKINSASRIYIYLRKSSTWTEMNDTTSDGKCVAGSPDCSEWFRLGAESASAQKKLLQLFNDLDKLVDNEDGALAGKVRYNTYGNDYLLYQGIPHKR